MGGGLLGRSDGGVETNDEELVVKRGDRGPMVEENRDRGGPENDNGGLTRREQRELRIFSS